MNGKLFFLILFFLTVSRYGVSQCTTLGQNPGTAFPVCGTTVFNQTTVPICGDILLAVPGCPGSNNGGAEYKNKNPFWYKFTCYQNGSFGFVVTPLDLTDDYDWQLYDLTGHANPDDVYTDVNMIVTGNWAGTYGPTGARTGGSNRIECASNPAANENSFAAMPQLIAGHEYILMISHYTDTQSGYALSFGGGSAVITDPKLPALVSADASCDATQIRIALNKKMKCKSLAADGSDFTINSNVTSISSANSVKCNTGFDLDTLVLTLTQPLPPGTFTITTRKGLSDGNTLLDNCDREIPVGDKVSFTIFPLLPTPMDSLTKIKCAPRQLELVFKKGILCTSIAADGSDFIITGPAAITVKTAAGISCSNGLATRILVEVDQPLQVGGLYTITLNNGSDGNTIFDECSQQTPAGSNIRFQVADTVNADFSFTIVYGCTENTVQYKYAQRNGVNSWNWNFDDSVFSTTQNPLIKYSNFRQKRATLIASNGTCSDTSRLNIFFDNLLEANFEITPLVCPAEPSKIVNKTLGRIVEWNWTFGNGQRSALKDPPLQFYPSRPSSDYIAMVNLIVLNDYGCYDTITRGTRVVFSCFIAVPAAFTPNGDGLNDYLYPLSAYKSKDLQFTVYNRFGQKVFSSINWSDKWDGRYKGQGADPGTYVWVLTYTNADTNKRVEQKGTSILLR